MGDQSTEHHSRFRIGTRGSPLALAQVEILKCHLLTHHPRLQIDVVPITTSGDWKPQDGEVPLAEQDGGKGLFVKDIENALLEGQIDCAVHSLKDVPTQLADSLAVDHVLPRGDARDALFSMAGHTIETLPEGASIGTVGPRRKAILLAMRPDLHVVPVRGNVETRLSKLQQGQVDAIILAKIGLSRLGIDKKETMAIFSTGQMLPACGQGVIAIETVENHDSIREILSSIHCTETGYCAKAERACLDALGGSCHSPIAAYACIEEGDVTLQCWVGSEDGGALFKEKLTRSYDADTNIAQEIGRELGEKMKSIIPIEIANNIF